MTTPTARASAQPSPSVVITPRRGWVALNLRELWANRELIYFFIWRDTKVRYRQTLFGVLWAIIQPLALMAVFAIFLGRLSGIAPTDVPYAAFVLVGLVPWTLFSKSVVISADSLVNASSLLQKVYFPRLIVPIAAIGAQVPDFLISLVVLVLLLLSAGIVPSAGVIAAIPVTFVGLVLTLGLGCWLSAFNVRYRDVRQVVPLAVQLWLFASPIVYAPSIIPASWRWLYDLNPMVGIIEGFRWAFLGGESFPFLPLAIASVVSVLVLVSGLIYFRRVERTFADII
jgi:lipopolysaccharide transport system permease protein